MNEVTKSSDLTGWDITHRIAYGIMPLAIIGNNRLNILLSIALCFLLLVKAISSNFRIYLSRNSKDIIFNSLMFALPKIGFFWNQGSSIAQSAFLLNGIVLLSPMLVISVSFVLITGNSKNKDHDLKSLLLFLFVFTSVAISLIYQASQKFDLRILYLYYNTDSFEDMLNNTLLGEISFGVWWDLVVCLPFLILYVATALRIHFRFLIATFVPSFLFLLAIGSRGGLVLYFLNFILINILNNKNAKVVLKPRLIISLTALFLFMGIVFFFLPLFVDISSFSVFQRGNGDLTQDTGRFNMWSYFADNIDKVYLFNTSLLATDVGDQISFHNYLLDSVQASGMLGFILSIAACLLVFKSSNTYLTKVISFTIVASRICGVPPFSNIFTYLVVLCIYPILNRLFNRNRSQG